MNTPKDASDSQINRLFDVMQDITREHVADLTADPTLAARLDADPALREAHVDKLTMRVTGHPSGRHCKPAIRYGREIVKRSDFEIEVWPTALAARNRLDALQEDGYTISGTDEDVATFAERAGCKYVARS